ncbi:MAG: SPOR domain-containing protein [Bacteroidota bacterium]|nr:SPOR domain-containing protein [Bacteroidota bacterium]
MIFKECNNNIGNCRKRKVIFSFIIILISHISIFTSSLHAQKLKTLIDNGDKAFADNDFFGAAIYYNQAILQDSTDIALQYKYAEASRLNYDFDIADRWYNKVYKTDAQGKLYPECPFWLATIKKSKGKYKDAKKLFDKYAKKNKKKKNDYFVKKAIQEVAACDYANLLIASADKSINIVHLDTSVNSKVSEYAPIQLDSVLYFSSLRNATDRDKKNNLNYNKIYTATQDSIKWQKAKELDTLFNKEGVHNANTAFNADNTKVYITRCDQKNATDFNCEIYFSEFKTGHWGALQKLPAEINAQGYTNTQPAIGFLGEEEVLFFSSNRPGGEGRMDIWYSKVNADGSYGKPVNAGKKVNTLDDEITPFYCKPCQELFFSSTWHKGLGGFDIFKSYYKNNELGEPQNVGIPVNSSYNDIYFSISSKRTEAFLSSNRPGSFFEEKESCCNDIYMFKIPGVPGIEEPPKKVDSTQIFVAEMKLLVPLTLYFHNDEPDKKTLAITTTKNYKKTYEDYSAMRDLYKKEYSKGAKGADLDRANNDIDVLFEDSVDAGMQDLEKFAQLMLKVLKDGEKVSITMKGYCSPLASTDYNVNLAKRRISSLRNYFMEYENGIFVPYVNSTNENEASIAFFNEDIGELKARPNVSDDYYDTKNSIFNPAAAIERKIQIIAVSTVSSKKDLKIEIPNTLLDSVKSEVIAPKRIDSVVVAPVLTPAITKDGAFAIQVGVNSHLSKAKATEASLKKAFKQPVIIVNEGGVFKVRISGFDTYDDAKLLLSKIRESGFPDAFIVSPKKE